MHNVSFSNSALFPQTSAGSNNGNGDNQPASNISPFLAPQNNPQFQGPMLYQSPSFGSGNPMSVAAQSSGVLGGQASLAQPNNPFNRANSGGMNSGGPQQNPSLE